MATTYAITEQEFIAQQCDDLRMGWDEALAAGWYVAECWCGGEFCCGWYLRHKSLPSVEFGREREKVTV